jgi:hypothetical protein
VTAAPVAVFPDVHNENALDKAAALVLDSDTALSSDGSDYKRGRAIEDRGMWNVFLDEGEDV